MMFVPVKKIEELQGEFKVRDVQVEGTNKFFAGVGGILVHNCGAQYALENPQKDYESSMRMCHWTEFEEIKKEQRHFDGSVCMKCYYDEYNEILDLMTKKLTHKKFV